MRDSKGVTWSFSSVNFLKIDRRFAYESSIESQMPTVTTAYGPKTAATASKKPCIKRNRNNSSSLRNLFLGKTALNDVVTASVPLSLLSHRFFRHSKRNNITTLVNICLFHVQISQCSTCFRVLARFGTRWSQLLRRFRQVDETKVAQSGLSGALFHEQ